MTRFYINPDLQICAHPDGWPECHAYPDHTPKEQALYKDAYEKALAQAKAEAVEVENQFAFYPTVNATTTPDSFVELELEVEFVRQVRTFGGWTDVSPENYRSTDEDYRTICRVKPQAKEMGENALPDANDKDVASIDPGVQAYYNSAHGYTEGAGINPMHDEHYKELSPDQKKMMAGFADNLSSDVSAYNRGYWQGQDDLRAQLSAAEKRIKSLEADLQSSKTLFMESRNRYAQESMDCVTTGNAEYFRGKSDAYGYVTTHLSGLLAKYAENELPKGG